MNRGAVAVLAVVATALVAYVFLFERTSLTSKELGERKDKVLTTFVRAKVDRLEVQRRGKRVVLERDPQEEGGEFGGWRMLEPTREGADDDAVDAVLGELEWLSARRTFENLSADDVRKFGLDKPRYRVAYRAGDARHVLALGNPDVHGEGVYARVDDEPLGFVVPKTLLETLDHDPLHYRSKEFLGEMTTAWTRSLAITAGGERKADVTKEGGKFWVAGEVKVLGDPKRIDPVLRAIDDLRATRFLEPEAVPAAEADLAHPARTVEVRIVPDEGREDREPLLVSLQVGSACAGHEGELYARAGDKGAPVCIKSEDAKAFELGAGDLRLNGPFAADPSTIEKLVLTQGKERIVLTREGETWKPDGDLKVDREAVEQWLTELSRETALQFLPAGAFTPRGSLALSLAGEQTEIVTLGQTRPDGSVLAQRGGEAALIAFPRSLADALTPSPRRFMPLSPWEAHQPSDVVAIEVRDGATERTLALSDGAWRVDAGKGPVASDQVRSLVRSLVKLRALSFVTEAPRPEHGLTPPAAELRMKTAKGVLTLAVGAETEAGVYARVDGGPVLDLPREHLAELKALAGTAAPPVDAEHADGHDEEDEGLGDEHVH